MYFVNLKINRCTKKLVFACKASLFETNNRAKFSCNFSRKLAKFTNTPMLLQNNPNVTRGHELLVKISNSASSASSTIPTFSRIHPFCTWILHLCFFVISKTRACVMFLHYYTYIHKILYSGRILWIPLTTMTLNKRPVLQPFFNWNANYING